MRIALVMAPFWAVNYPPLAVPLLAACLQSAGHSVDKYDFNRQFYLDDGEPLRLLWDFSNPAMRNDFVERYIALHQRQIGEAAGRIIAAGPAMAGFALYGTTAAVGGAIARRVKERQPGIVTVAGGPACCNRAGGEALMRGNPAFDIAVVGEGEATLPALADAIGRGAGPSSCPGILYRRGGELVFNGSREGRADLDALPVPDFSGLLEAYDRSSVVLPVQASRGCINRCAFCSEGLYWDRYRCMSAEALFGQVVRLAQLHNPDQFVFHDSLINGNLAVLENFCDLMTAHRLDFIIDKLRRGAPREDIPQIVWSGQALPRGDMGPELLRKMKAAGCYRISYGVETASPGILKTMNKGGRTVEEMATVIRNTHEAGIAVQVNLIIGLPGETEEDFRETQAFIRRLRPQIDRVSPMPSCMISPECRFGRHPDEYGIVHADQPFFWESNNGENTYAVRYDRYERFCRFAAGLGFPEDVGLFLEHPDKWFLLGEYYRHIGREDLARESDRRLSGTRMGALLKALA